MPRRVLPRIAVGLVFTALLAISPPAWSASRLAPPTTTPPAPSPTRTPPRPAAQPPDTTTAAPSTTGPTAPTQQPSGDDALRDRLRDRLPPPFGNGPSFFDIGGRIRQAVNDWFRDLVASALTPTLDLLGQSVFSTPDLTAPGGRTSELWWMSVGIANTAYVLLVLVGGALVMGHESVQTQYSVKEIAPRLVVGFIAANASLLIAGHAIGFANAISRALLGQGVDPGYVSDQIKQLALAPLDGSGIFLVLIAGVIAALALVILASYVIRVALLVILIAGAPLALACHALPQTEGLAQGWWRAFAGCLGVQVGQALTLVTALRVFFAADRPSVLGLGGGGQLVDLVVVACLLWILARLPVWAGRAVFSSRRSMLVRLAKSYLVYRIVRGVASAVGAAR
jgi:hypothetical protein